MVLVVDLNDTPWILATADLAAFWGADLGISTDNCERYLGEDLVVLGRGLLVIVLVSRTLEDLNVVVVDIRENLQTISNVTLASTCRCVSHSLGA